MTDSNRIKLSDFGLSSKLNTKKLVFGNVGTPNLMAPEVRTKSEEGYLGIPADLWSCGIVLHYMLYGSYPFNKESSSQGHIDSRYINVSKHAKELLAGIIKLDPKKRLSIPEIQSHPWM